MQAPVPENPPQVQGQGLFGQGSIQIMLTNERWKYTYYEICK